MVTTPLYYNYHIFLSYSRKDYPLAVQLYRYFTMEGLRVWIDQRIELGKASWKVEIENAIKFSGCVVALLSPDANKSKWVRSELDFAGIQNKKIFPVHTRGNDSDSIPFDLTSTQRIDIRNNLSQLPLLLNAIRNYLGIVPPPPPSNPSPPPKPQVKSKSNPRIILGIVTLLSMVTLFMAGWPKSISIVLHPSIPKLFNVSADITYHQGRLKILSMRYDLNSRDIHVLNGSTIPLTQNANLYFAVEVEFECLINVCNNPPESTLIVLCNDDQPVYPLSFGDSSGIGGESIHYGYKMKRWFIFHVPKTPHTLLINPQNVGSTPQEQRRIPL